MNECSLSAVSGVSKNRGHLDGQGVHLEHRPDVDRHGRSGDRLFSVFTYPSLRPFRLRSAFAANKPFASKILMASERDG